MLFYFRKICFGCRGFSFFGFWFLTKIYKNILFCSFYFCLLGLVRCVHVWVWVCHVSRAIQNGSFAVEHIRTQTTTDKHKKQYVASLFVHRMNGTRLFALQRCIRSNVSTCIRTLSSQYLLHDVCNHFFYIIIPIDWLIRFIRVKVAFWDFCVSVFG